MLELQNLSQQKWLDELNSLQFKNKIRHIIKKISTTRDKWIKIFEQSIQLWRNFMMVKIQSSVKDIKSDNKQNSQILVQLFSKQLTELIGQTEDLVLKGLKNIQKLYMVPQLKQKTSKNKNQLFQPRTKSISKNRSSSLTSCRNTKSSLFSTAKKQQKIKNSHFKNTSNSVAQNFIQSFTNSSIVKKCKPRSIMYQKQQKYNNNNKNNLQTTTSSNFKTSAIQSQKNINSNIVPQQLTQSLSQFLYGNSKIKQTQMFDKLSNKFQGKLKNVQSDLNEKLNIIIQNLSNLKTNNKKAQQHQEKQLQPKQNIPIKDNRLNISSINQQKSCLKSQFIQNHNKQTKRKGSFIKKPISNPISQQNYQVFEQSQEMQTPLKVKQNTGQTKAINIELYQKNLQCFINQTKKVKLPVSQKLVEIFINFYTTTCKQYETIPKTQKFPPQTQTQTDIPSLKNQLKQLLIKLKKLLSMANIKQDLSQKLNIYITYCIVCTYNLVLQQNYEPCNEIGKQADILIQRL